MFVTEWMGHRGQPEVLSQNPATFFFGVCSRSTRPLANQQLWKNLKGQNKKSKYVFHQTRVPCEMSGCGSKADQKVDGERWCPYWILNKTRCYTLVIFISCLNYSSGKNYFKSKYFKTRIYFSTTLSVTNKYGTCKVLLFYFHAFGEESFCLLCCGFSRNSRFNVAK